MGKLNSFGAGSRIAIVLLPWLLATILLSSTNKYLFAWTNDDKTLLHLAGIILMATGLVRNEYKEL